MKNLRFLSVAALLMTMNSLFAQTGPGGVGNSTTNPYWIDVHSNGGTSGSSVSSVSDFSGNGSDATQGTASLQPTFTTNAVNGVSALSFDGTDCMLSGANSALNGNQYLDYYIYGNITNNAVLSLPFNIDYGTIDAEWAYSGVITQGGATQTYARNSVGQLVRSNFGASTGYNLFQGTFNGSTNQLIASLNFSQTGIHNAVSATTPAVNEGVMLGGSPTSYRMTGLLSEVFVFNVALNTAEDKIVQNYVSAKFGTTISNDMYAYQATHQFGVIGIGQDDAANNHLSSQGNGVVSISKGTLSDGDYLFVGHDGASLTNLVSNVPVSMTNGVRLERVWRADETVDIGLITLVFDLDGPSDFSSDPNNYRLLIDHTDSDFTTVDGNFVGTYNAGTNSVTFLNVDLAAGDFFTLAGDAPEDIISISDGLWSEPTTWNCTCLPNTYTGVTIDAGHEVTLDVDANIVDLTLNPTSSLVWNSSEDLEIQEDLTVNGVLDMGASGELSMVGIIPQTIDLGGGSIDFTNLDINNLSTGVSLTNGSLILNGTLSPNSGGFDFSGGNFIVNSTTATTSGRVGPVIGGFTMNGVVSVRRFLPAGVAGNRNMSSPVIGATLSQWDADIEISGEGFPDGCAYDADGCYYSVKKYELGDYVDVTDINQALVSGGGYEVFLGTDLNTFDGATITSTGTLRSAADFTTFAKRNGWSIMGNPYASPIQFSTIDHHTNVGDYFYVYDPVTGGFQWYDGSNNTSSVPELADGKLAIGQGFWVFNANTNTDKYVTFKQSDKTSNTATFIRNSDVDESIYLTMKEEGTTYSCVVNIDFNEKAYDNFDSLDIRHLSTGLEKASSLMLNSSEGMLRKQFLSDDDRNKTLDVSINILNEGYFTINGSNLENANRYSNITLIDNFTGDVIDLKKYASYAFHSEEGEYQRFQLVLSNEVITDNATSIFESDKNESQFTITQLGNAIDIESDKTIEGITEFSVVNLLGQESVYSESLNLEAGSNMVFLPQNLSGMYLIVIKSTNGVKTKKIML